MHWVNVWTVSKTIIFEWIKNTFLSHPHLKTRRLYKTHKIMIPIYPVVQCGWSTWTPNLTQAHTGVVQWRRATSNKQVVVKIGRKSNTQERPNLHFSPNIIRVKEGKICEAYSTHCEVRNLQTLFMIQSNDGFFWTWYLNWRFHASRWICWVGTN